MSTKKKVDENFASEIAVEIEKRVYNCKTINNFIDTAYSFSYKTYGITPIQIRNEIGPLLEILYKLKPENILEIGTANGGTLFLLCQVSSPHATILSVDLPDGPYGGDLYPRWKESFYNTFAKEKQKLSLIRKDSHDPKTLDTVKELFDGNKIDFLLIDGDHSYEGVKKDFEIYSRFVKEGGIIAFHDITPGSKKSVGGVPEFWEQIKSKYLSIEIVDNPEREGYGIGLIFYNPKNNFELYPKILSTIIDLKQLQIKLMQTQIKQERVRIEKNPYGLLLSLYDQRRDLQETFPEVSRGDYSRLVEWAVAVGKGEIKEKFHSTQILDKLSQHFHEYQQSISLHKEKEKIGEKFEVSKEKNRLDNLLAKRETDLSVTREQLQKREADLQERTTDLSVTREQLQKREADLQERTTDLSVTREQLQKREADLQERTTDLSVTREQLQKREADLDSTKNELYAIKSSISYLAIAKILRAIDKILPPNTKRGEFIRLVRLGLFVTKSRGLKEAQKEFSKYLGKKKKEQLSFGNDSKNEKKIIAANHFMDILNGKNADRIERGMVDIIIPVYNSFEYSTRCIDSVLEHSDNCRIIIVDDSSTDKRINEYLDSIKTRFKENKKIIILKNKKNLGFVKSVNRAYKQTKNNFVILNSDTEVTKGWLDRLFAPIIKDKKVASVTPFSNSATICSFPNFVEDNKLFKDLEPSKIDSFFAKFGPSTYFEIPTGVGFCFAVNKEIAKENGLFDEKAFGKGYGEENDWCMRASHNGYKNVIAPNLFVYHNHGTSFDFAERKKLKEENLKKVIRNYPEYQEKVNRFINEDLLQPIRDNFSIIIDNFTRQQKLLLIIDHTMGGGANKFSDNIVKGLVNTGNNIIHLKYNHHKKSVLLQYYGYVKKSVELSCDIDTDEILKKIISFFDVDHILVNQTISWNPIKTIKIIRQSHTKYTIYMHDYFHICPSWNLINYKGKFCNIPDMFECQQCLAKNVVTYADYKYIYPNENFSIYTWRKENFEFLSKAEQVICFSDSSKRLLLKAYPELINCKVLEPSIEFDLSEHEYKKIDTVTKSSLTIGILGAIGYIKGSSIIKEILNKSELNKLPVKFVIIGYTNEDMPSNEKLLIHGKYSEKELPSLLKFYDVDLVLIPSITPETFSYTTSEAFLLGYPVMCFDIGAPAERVRRLNAGIVLDEISAQSVIDSLKTILSNKGNLNELQKNALKYKQPSFDSQIKVITDKLE